MSEAGKREKRNDLIALTKGKCDDLDDWFRASPKLQPLWDVPGLIGFWLASIKSGPQWWIVDTVIDGQGTVMHMVHVGRSRRRATVAQCVRIHCAVQKGKRNFIMLSPCFALSVYKVTFGLRTYACLILRELQYSGTVYLMCLTGLPAVQICFLIEMYCT